MKKWCFLLVALIFSGCAHTGTEQAKQEGPVVTQEKPELSAALVAQTIIKGKTTKEEIVAKFGPPNSVVKNTRLPSKEMLAKAKGPLPPIARTVEFWHYWTVPPKNEMEKSAATGAKTNVFRVMIFMDENGVAVDYTTEEHKVDLSQPAS
jgi:hypothetical protein